MKTSKFFILTFQLILIVIYLTISGNTLHAQGTCADAIIIDLNDPTLEGDSFLIIVSGLDVAYNSSTCNIDGDFAGWAAIHFPFGESQLNVTLATFGGCGTFGCENDVTAALYAGSCSALTPIDDCIDLTSGANNLIINGPWSFTGLTGGNTYYWRLSEEDDDGGFASFTFTVGAPCESSLGTFPGN